MTDRTPSKTAVGAAALRAVHQLIDSDPKILDDRVILQLLEKQVVDKIQQNPQRYQSPRLLALRAHILVRARYIEEQLANATANGLRQYVILGAGLDTFAYRQPDWAQTTAIFEVDQPASQGEKRALLAKAGIPTPANLAFVPVDFETQNPASILPAHGFDPTRPAFFSWAGVTPYLNRAAIEAVFRFVASLPPTTAIGFTFASVEGEVKRTERAGKTEEISAALGEPWLSHYTPEELKDLLMGMGYCRIQFLTPEEINQRYIGQRQDALRAFNRINTACAWV